MISQPRLLSKGGLRHQQKTAIIFRLLTRCYPSPQTQYPRELEPLYKTIRSVWMSVIKPSVDGVVQVEIIENGSLTPLDSVCQAVVGDVQVTRSFGLTIPWSAGETVTYSIWARTDQA